MGTVKRITSWWLVSGIIALATATSAAQTLDGVAIDPDAELVVAVPDDTTNMDPRLGMGSTRSNYIRQVYESLVDVDAQGKPMPGLALSWKPAGDLAWEFTLRRGVTFHNGEAFNADTVLFNLDRMFRKNLDRLGIKDVTAATAFEKIYPVVTRWEKVNDATVRIHTSE
ncbi:MAG TPA: ABC transporter substrate-binding protein, partial [Methylomirabilota bacterium]